MRHGNPDRIPVSPFTLGALDYSSDIARDLITKTDPLIRTHCGIDPFVGCAAHTESIRYGDTVATRWKTPKGDLVSAWRKTDVTEAAVDYGIMTPEDAEKFLSIPYSCEDLKPDAYYDWCSRIGDEGLVMVEVTSAICLPAQWLSPENFCIWTLDYPDLILELTQVGAKRVNEYVERLCRAGVKAFRVIGGEYAVTQLGPSGFDKLVSPFDAELVDIIHSYGAIAYYHCHGCVSGYLDKLADIGMDALDPLEAPPWGDVEIGEAVGRIGDRVCLVGNLDDMEVIDHLPTNRVLEIAAGRLASVSGTSFILGGTASGTFSERGARNFIAMADMVRGISTSMPVSTSEETLALVR